MNGNAFSAMVQGYSPPEVDRIWGIWGSYCNIPKAMFYLLKVDYKGLGLRCHCAKHFSEKQGS